MELETWNTDIIRYWEVIGISDDFTGAENCDTKFREELGVYI
jgi:hypothetical protein